MMKLLVVACCVVLSISQIQALPTNDNKVEIESSKDSNNYLACDACNVQELEAQSIEEALEEQTSALCPDPSCDCEDSRKLANFQGTRRDTGELCTVIGVAYCQGVCLSRHRSVFYTKARY